MSPATDVPSVAKSIDDSRSSAIATYMGHEFNVADPSTWTFDLDDIAQSLSNICRYGGHVKFYSVAEHSVRVASMLRQRGESTRIVLMGLLHDATESYIGDVPRPLKKILSVTTSDGLVESIESMEQSLNLALLNSFGLIVDDQFDEEWARIRTADIDTYYEERDERPNVGGSLTPVQAKDMFMGMFTALWRDFQLKVG